MSDDTRCQTDRLSEYLDGSLDVEASERWGAHLNECESCRTVLADLEMVRAAARTLETREPEKDLWPGIQEGLDRAQVIELNERMGRPSWRPRRPLRGGGVFLSIPQLSAAAAVLVMVVGAGTWAIGRGSVERAAGPTSVSEVDGPGVVEELGGVRMASSEDTRLVDYLNEFEKLQAILAEGRSSLDPGTVRVLERNLALIDRAIRESIEALQLDPGNAFVEEHMWRTYERKAAYLRDATTLLRLTD